MLGKAVGVTANDIVLRPGLTLMTPALNTGGCGNLCYGNSSLFPLPRPSVSAHLLGSCTRVLMVPGNGGFMYPGASSSADMRMALGPDRCTDVTLVPAWSLIPISRFAVWLCPPIFVG